MNSEVSWRRLEEEVRTIAATIWGARFESRQVHGRQIDAYTQLGDNRAIAIEVTEVRTIAKLQEDLNKLIHVRNVNFSSYILTECICVVPYEPTLAMLTACSSINIAIYRIEDFRHKFLPFDEYREARSRRPFGSAVNPETGERDGRQYVIVHFQSDDIHEATVEKFFELLSSKTSIVLTGEYGTGKSKCTERLFELLSNVAWETYQFPISIDLRRSWGLRDRYEIIRRHLDELSLSRHADAFIKAYNDGYLLLLIDGFDELGTQTWSDNPNTMKALRADALSGTRDLVANQRSGLLVCGRDHYFDSAEELIASLGLAGKQNTVNLRSNDEFSYEEIEVFLENAGYSYDIPEWLPRKPLTCEFFAKLFGELRIELTEDILDPVQFWDLFFDAVCNREAGIHASFDTESIKRILIAVAALTRTKASNVGPLALSEIQDGFKTAIGYAPIEQAGVLLQRLPGLGRAAADSQDRQFVDSYLLEGLRATHLVEILNDNSQNVIEIEWINPTSEVGLLIAGRRLANLGLVDDAIAFCRKNSRGRNKTLLFDIAASLMVSGIGNIEFGALEIDGGYASLLDFSGSRISGLFISNSVIDKIILSGLEVGDVTITATDIGLVEGISNEAGVPGWLQGSKIESFTSVATVSRIKNATISANHKVLVTILRKTFFQKGAARKEEALLRGLGRLVKPGVVDRIVNRLISEGLVSRVRGDTGNLYAPIRTHTRRVGKILSELNMSQDPVWSYVEEL